LTQPESVEESAARVTLSAIESACVRLRGVIRPTPLICSFALGRRLGLDLFLKPEMLQRTGSFKLRGAYNKISQLPSCSAAATSTSIVWRPLPPNHTADPAL
jgi:threonine dehydratase